MGRACVRACCCCCAFTPHPALNSLRWPLYGLCGADQRGEALPIAFMLTSSETHDPILQFFQVLWEHCPMWVGTHRCGGARAPLAPTLHAMPRPPPQRGRSALW
jgi:hypothetical protein